MVRMAEVGRDAGFRDNWNVHPLVIKAKHNIAKATELIYFRIIFSFLDLFFAGQPHHIMSDRVF